VPRREIERLARVAGYGEDEPLVIGLSRRAAAPVFVCQGPYTGTTLVYAASLSKQVVAACMLLVARRGLLAVDEPLARWLPELPGWARDVRLRQLVHHTGGLPDDGLVDALLAGGRTGPAAGHGARVLQRGLRLPGRGGAPRGGPRPARPRP
jgi:CubicO group peptidase (beta-lactamase class C family)